MADNIIQYQSARPGFVVIWQQPNHNYLFVLISQSAVLVVGQISKIITILKHLLLKIFKIKSNLKTQKSSKLAYYIKNLGKMTVKTLNFWNVLAKNQRCWLSDNNSLVNKVVKFAHIIFFSCCFRSFPFCFFRLVTARNLITDGGFIQFFHQLEYKCELYSSQLGIVDCFYSNCQLLPQDTRLIKLHNFINCGISIDCNLQESINTKTKTKNKFLILSVYRRMTANSC